MDNISIATGYKPSSPRTARTTYDTFVSDIISLKKNTIHKLFTTCSWLKLNTEETEIIPIWTLINNIFCNKDTALSLISVQIGRKQNHRTKLYRNVSAKTV